MRKETKIVKMMRPKKLLCFDLDGTLSQHKSHLPQENKDLLDGLCARYKVIMVGAGNAPLIYNQMEQYPVDIIGNYGMQESAIVDGEFKLIREDTVVFDPDRSKRRVLYMRSALFSLNMWSISEAPHPLISLQSSTISMTPL